MEKIASLTREIILSYVGKSSGAKQLNRRCVGIELNPIYIQLAQERLNATRVQTSPLTVAEQLELQLLETSTEESNGYTNTSALMNA